MNSNANEKYNVVGDRTLGAAKPVDPATRLSELLAQSLEELTRPFDPPRPIDPLTRAATPPMHPPDPANDPAAPPPDLAEAMEAAAPPVESRLDADRALAELEAELFSAANRPATEAASEPVSEPASTAEPAPDAARDEPPADAPPESHDPEPPPAALTAAPAAPAPAPPPDADAERLVARVRRLMLVSMLVTVIAVGSVFGFIGYRVFKGEGSTAKTADKLPEGPAVPAEMTLALPRDARIVQSAVAEDRLIITLDVGGKIEVRTFDLKTLQPAARLTFSTTP